MNKPFFKIFEKTEDDIIKNQDKRVSQNSYISSGTPSQLSENVPHKPSVRYSQTLEDQLLSKIPKVNVLEVKHLQQRDSSIISESNDLSDESNPFLDSQQSLLKVETPPKSALAKTKPGSIHQRFLKKKSTFDETEEPKYIKKTAIAEIDDDDGVENKIRFEDIDTFIQEGKKPISYRGMRIEYGRSPKVCEKYMDVEEYSKNFIDDLLDEASIRGKDLQQLSSLKIVEGIEYNVEDNSLSSASVATYVCVLEWPTIREFNIEIGSAKIEEFLSYWKFDEDWKHCTNFLYGESDIASDYYQYEAMFSIPCKQYPIPQVTASVYFTFEVSRIRPKHCLVDVYYWFEGQKEKFKPGLLNFQEAKLFHIVDAKINFYKTLNF